MRVAYLCTDPGVPVFGRKGASVHVQEVARALRERGARVELFATRWGDDRPEDLRDVPVHALPERPKGDPGTRERLALAQNEAVLARLRAAGPFDLVYERYALFGCAGMAYAAEIGVPGILEVNAPLIEEQRRHRDLIHEAEAVETTRRALADARAVVAVSREVAHYLEGFAEARGKVAIIPNGVNPARFAVRSDVARAPDFTVGFVGTLKPWHGLPTLLSAFARLELPGSRLRLVGDGPERGALEAQAQALGVAARVTFTGALAPERVPAELARMDVAVAPYPQLETFYFSPLKVYEYLAAGVPVVASRVGQLEGMLEDGKTGLLVAPDDPDALARALERLAGDEGLRRRLAQAGRAQVLQRHTWAAVAARILEVAGREAVTP